MLQVHSALCASKPVSSVFLHIGVILVPIIASKTPFNICFDGRIATLILYRASEKKKNFRKKNACFGLAFWAGNSSSNDDYV